MGVSYCSAWSTSKVYIIVEGYIIAGGHLNVRGYIIFACSLMGGVVVDYIIVPPTQWCYVITCLYSWAYAIIGSYLIPSDRWPISVSVMVT